jgi:hypothetical protein
VVRYANTAIVFGSVREALLYFDHIVPVNISWELVQVGAKFGSLDLPRNFRDEVLPPELSRDPQFFKKLVTVNNAVYDSQRIIIKKFGYPCMPKSDILSDALSDADCASQLETAATEFFSLVGDFGLQELTLDAGDLCCVDDANQSEVVITLPSLSLVDVSHCSWEQILEFRRDDEARDKLRRLRLFAYENYAGKSKDYVEDDILKRIADYDRTVKQWGFETIQSALNMLLTSKVGGGALPGSLVSTLFGAPTLAVATAVGGGVLEIGRIALEVSKQRFALRKLTAENPVSYISHIRSKFKSE